MENLGKYIKLWVALAGVGAQILAKYLGIDDLADLDADTIIAILTAAGVYAVPNNKFEKEE